jgi:hypothetical protein
MWSTNAVKRLKESKDAAKDGLTSIFETTAGDVTSVTSTSTLLTATTVGESEYESSTPAATVIQSTSTAKTKAYATVITKAPLVSNF